MQKNTLAPFLNTQVITRFSFNFSIYFEAQKDMDTMSQK